jgi:peptidoglycan/LPS O-acetylase OafA/YrhL
MKSAVNAATGGRPEARHNGFGALRLVLASLVIVEHAGVLTETAVPEVGGLGCGSVAVDGFFLISGYLITGSVHSTSPAQYLWRRVLRIYPAFIVCSLLLSFVLRPLVGGPGFSIRHLQGPVLWMLLLHEPVSGGAFSGLRYAHLDGSMWTIAYEFRCYLLALLFGLIGVSRHRRVYAAITILLLAVYPLSLLPAVRQWNTDCPFWLTMFFGNPISTTRLVAAFLVGGCFRLFAPPLDGRIATVCALALAPLAFLPKFGEVALLTLGAYVLFWVALVLESRFLRTLNSKNDISYGVYLYAWPITSSLLWWWRDAPFYLLLVLTFLGALACGAVSWHLIEKPALALKHVRLRRVLVAPAPRLG